MKRAATLYVFLALLVWGLLAFDRGLFHDDAFHLAWAQRAASRPPWGLLEPMVAPTAGGRSRPAPLPARARALLAGPRLLARLLPDSGAPDAMLAP